VFYGDDERIQGFRNPKIQLYFNAWTFKTYLNFTYDEETTAFPTTKVLPLLTPHLAPDSFTSNLDSFLLNVEADKITHSKPFGTLVTEYRAPGDPAYDICQSPTYAIYHHRFCTDQQEFDEEFLDLHSRVQLFVLLEIDGGTYIDATDPRWEVYLLYERASNSDAHHLIGYCTAYRFLSFPEAFRLRISQFLLFPPYQKKGHGRKLLQVIYDDARARGASDVPVEDPAPEFARLRGE
jgi:histone acetyltransferase 1